METFTRSNYDIREKPAGTGRTIVEAFDKKTGKTVHSFEVWQGASEKESYIPQAMGNVTSADLLGRKSLKEAATIREGHSTSEFPSQLREDFRVIMLSAYETIPDVLYPLFYNVTSTKQEETYSGINMLEPASGRVEEDAPYFTLRTSAKTDVTITNYKRGGIVEINEELIMFDKSNEISRLAAELGASIKYQRYQLEAGQITTSANTTAQSATVSLNTAGLETMLTAYQTQTDSASGKLMVFPADTMLVPAARQWDARRLLESAAIPGQSTNDVNVMQSILRLVVCPLLDSSSTTRFYVGRANSTLGLIYQNVIGPQPEVFTQDTRTAQSDDVFIYDLIRYKARLYYGLGVIDNKIWHRSTT